MGKMSEQADAAASGGPPLTFDPLVDDYLSEAHRDHPATGCPVGALDGVFRRHRGLPVGIAELMKEASLTVGGFYKHFSSRDDLVAEAMSSALGVWNQIARLKNPLREATSATSER